MSLRPLRGRRQELEALRSDAEVARTTPQLVIVSGPRRVGKSFLLHHLLATLPPNTLPVYFEATQAGEANQLERFGGTLRGALGEQAPPFGRFASWEQALDTLGYVARSRPLVVVLDEATYLMSSTSGFASTVKTVWDRLTTAGPRPQLMLVLTGSAVGLIEDTLAYSGPLHGRATRILRLQPFTAAQASAFCHRPAPAALLEAYAACGGYPLHLDRWDFEAPTDRNLLRLAGTPGGVLLEDGDQLLVSLPEAHRRVLLSVGQGRARRSEIDNDVGSRADRPLDALVRARYVRPALPLGAPAKARPEYRVEDAYLRFWFRVLANSVQRVEAGQGGAVLAAGHEQWQNQLGWCFEQAAREHARHLVSTGELPTEALVDEWWTTSGQPVQVDVLGMVRQRTAFVGEARWRAQPLGSAVVDELAAKLRWTPTPVAQPLLLLWGRNGVRPEVQVGAVRGYSLADMLER